MPKKLPQNESAAILQRRRGERGGKQGFYQFVQDGKFPIPRIRTLPERERFEPKYSQAGTLRTFKIANNQFAVTAHRALDPLDHPSDYDEYFPRLPKPSVVDHWREDASFVDQRVAGANPLVLKRVSATAPLPGDHTITDAHVRRAFGPRTSLQGLIDANRLFQCDYKMLWRVPWGAGPTGPKYLPAPLLLLAWRPGVGGGGELAPLAIQVTRGNGPHRVFTPFDTDRRAWLLARTAVQIADGNIHEVSSHLMKTHLVLEPFVIAAERQFSVRHPLLTLLRPHLKYILAINEDARALLINPGGRVEQLLGGTLDGSLEMGAELHADFSFWRDARLPSELDHRGVRDPDVLPHYPYRDDGMLVYTAIERFVSAYVDAYYSTNRDVRDDEELQAFADELKAADGGRVQGLTPRNTIRTLTHLKGVLTAVIWTSSAQHAAVNYTQWDYYGHTPNSPFAAYRDLVPFLDQSPSPLSERDMMAYFPPHGLTATQLETMYYLGTYRYDRLGTYPHGTFTDAAARRAATTFAMELEQIDREILERNRLRRFAYVVLRPALIPNSTSV